MKQPKKEDMVALPNLVTVLDEWLDTEDAIYSTDSNLDMDNIVRMEVGMFHRGCFSNDEDVFRLELEGKEGLKHLVVGNLEDTKNRIIEILEHRMVAS